MPILYTESATSSASWNLWLRTKHRCKNNTSLCNLYNQGFGSWPYGHPLWNKITARHLIWKFKNYT